MDRVGILGLDDNLWYGIVVHAKGHTLHLGIVVGRTFGHARIGVILFIAAEDVELLIIVSQTAYLRKDIVTSLDAYGVCILADKSRVVIGRLLVSTVIDVFQLFRITQIAIVGLSADDPVVGIVSEVEGTNQYLALILLKSKAPISTWPLYSASTPLAFLG